MKNTRTRHQPLSDRVTDRVDLVIDLLTLGQYGLERVPGDDAGERCGPLARADWEASRPATSRASARPSSPRTLTRPQRQRGDCDWRSDAPSWTSGARSSALRAPQARRLGSAA